jgi:hypothetical protein
VCQPESNVGSSAEGTKSNWTILIRTSFAEPPAGCVSLSTVLVTVASATPPPTQAATPMAIKINHFLERNARMSPSLLGWFARSAVTAYCTPGANAQL